MTKGLHEANITPLADVTTTLIVVFLITMPAILWNGINVKAAQSAAVEQVVATYRAREFVDKYAYVAILDEIQDNDFNLNIARYVDTYEPEPDIDVAAVQVEIDQLDQELSQARQELGKHLNELGYGA